MADAPKPQQQMHVVESKDGSIKITQPKGRKHHGVTVLLDSDDVLREQATGFANFLREYAVVGLAVGFIVGQQANGVAKQLVTSFLDPIVKMWFGQNLSTRMATIHHNHQPIQVPWGAFVYTLLEFFIVVIVIYILIKLFQLDKLKKAKEK